MGNPTDALFYKTLANNIKIFHTELDFWSPKYVILLTDGLKRDNETIIDWTSEFIKSLNNCVVPYPIDEVIWDKSNPLTVYKIGTRYIILSLHPQGRKVELHQNTIINIIENIEQNGL